MADVDVDVTALMDPEVAAAVAPMAALPPVTTAKALARAREVRRAWFEAGPLSDAVDRSEHVVSDETGVTVRVHRPRADAAAPRPAVYSIHGGGYIVGSAEMEDPRLDHWVTGFDCVGIAVEYRLAPEHPYPTPLEDCYAGLCWVHDHAAELGIDPGRVGIAGGSAGGGLAAALALLARDRGGPSIAFQLLGCPMIDDRQTTPSSAWPVPVWAPAANTFGWQSYLGDAYGGDVPGYAAPARATDLTGLPPALVTVGGVDGFLDEDVAYAHRLLQAGVPTELHVFPGGCHGFEVLAPDAELSRRARRITDEWVGARLRGAGAPG